MAIGIEAKTGDWITSDLENNIKTAAVLNPDGTINTPEVTISQWGMMYRSSAGLSERTKVLGNELKTMLDNTALEVDNPLVLGKITALSGNYNMARQLQSNVMKSVKDAAQAITRNV